MTEQGCYGDGRTFDLPDGWAPLAEKVVATAVNQTLAALDETSAGSDLARYYDRGGSYAGTLFLDAQPNDPVSVEAADLYAVTTLSITLDARYGRLLLDDGDVRSKARRQLRNLDVSLPITDLGHGEGGSAETLMRTYELHHTFKTLLTGDGNRWVTAAKLCARKRPRLFPVRDNLVCQYLGAGRPLRKNDGWPGDFAVDVQVYAHLMTHPGVVAKLSLVREECSSRGVRLDEDDLRLLDGALWMFASRAARA